MTAISEPIKSRDAATLDLRHRATERARRVRALALVLPLFIFLFLSFVMPIVVLLRNAVYDPTISQLMPHSSALLTQWDGKGLPDEPTFAALAADLASAYKAKTIAQIGTRLNYELSGIRSKVIASGRKASEVTQGPYKDAMLGIDSVWGERGTWAVLKRSASPYTSFFVLSALDLNLNQDGALTTTPSDRAIYITIFVRTLTISALVTVATLLLGYPVAYLLAILPTRTSNLLMILVLLPFWTSLLVRTTAWFVLLQDQGIINDALRYLHLTNAPLPLIFSRFGTVVAMTHIQLPFTLLPIYSVMKTISPNYVRAARSLGAGPFLAFWKIYFPLTVPGIAAGCLLTFILCLGYYITPALVGGPTDQMVSGFIAQALNGENNWGKASALGAVLLFATIVLYFVYNRLVGIDKIRFG
ncbi:MULTISPECIES: ABC transporter permease [Mesorhizobium]|uniref:ABC transporter permease n=1 Tax=Mesorhizobium TaxID=68287 RepID=UPI0003CF4B8D|nr:MULTISPECIES: ABC transporter permease [Mesorhizobium]ESY64042.1 polyamine ABC transporter substrate-binding protein [Mesorhizobium sp. LNHC232B00]WJI35753.1 ABC transporter permease [Mesorhizobium opportunistum]